jgi:1,4-alpha-glucan branching enzyme
MQKDSSKQITKETQFSLLAVEVKKVSLVGEFNNWNPDSNRVPHAQEEELIGPPVLTQMSES